MSTAMISTETKPAKETVTEGFRVIENQIKLSDRVGIAPALYGESAYLPGFGTVIRTQVSGRGPFPLTRIHEWDTVTRQRGRELGMDLDAHAVLERSLDRAAIKGGVFGLDCSPRERELLDFIAKQPHISKIIGIERNLPVRKFDLGRVSRPRVFGWGDLDCWYGFLERHAAGDFGFGSFDDTIELSEELVWSLPLQPAAVQNSVAILFAKHKPIRSSYAVAADQFVNVLTLPYLNAENVCKTFIWVADTWLIG